jgi:rhodanese-related sulfurtransferase
MVEIDPHQLNAKLAAGERVVLIDVREPWEHELCALPNSTLIPLGELPTRTGEVRADEGALVVAYCHHGVRSLRAAAILAHAGLRVASLAGGIDRWSLEIDRAVPRY